MNDIVERLRRTGDFIAAQTGKENAGWVYEAANEIARLREALQHARVRFECLADEFKDDECNVNWAMCSRCGADE
jgi:hypothetical protein